MANRTSKKQTIHDMEVEKQARYYRDRDYEVWADIKGWGQPALRNDYRPDVVATLRDNTIIIEVETSDSIKNDEEQINAFKSYARDHPNVEFKLIIAD